MSRFGLTYVFLTCVVCLTLKAQVDNAPQPLQWQPVNMPGLGSSINDLIVSPHDSNRLLVGGQQFGIYWSNDQGSTWQSSTGLSCFNVNSFLWDPTNPNTVWAATMNGVYTSSDAGQSWECRSEGMPIDGFSESYTYLAPISTLIIDPVDPQRLLAFCGVSDSGLSSRARLGGVWETTSGGLRWHKVCTMTREGATNDPTAKGINITAASFAGGIPMLVYATSDEAGFFESTDGGKTWVQQITGLPHMRVVDLWVEPGKANTARVNLSSYKDTLADGDILPGGIYQTLSGGLSWFPVTTPIPKTTKGKLQEVSSFPVFAVAPKDPAIIYTFDTSVKSAIIYKTTDGGKTWPALATQKNQDQEQTDGLKELFQVKTFLPFGLSDPTVLEIDPATSDTIYIAGGSFIIQSKDGGKTWTDLAAKPVEDEAWAGRGLAGLDVTDFIWNPANSSHLIVACSNSAKFLETKDSGISWMLRGTDPYYWGGGSSGCITGETIYLGTGQFGLFGSIIRFNGTDWQTISGQDHGLPVFKRCGQVTDIFARPEEPAIVTAVIGGRLFRSETGGTSWTLMANQRNLGWIAPIPGSPNYYISGRPNSYRVVDKKLTAIGGPRSAGRAVCDKDGRLYLAANKSLRGGLWRYASGKWFRLLDEDFIADVAVDPTNPKRLAICTSDPGTTANDKTSGVWISDNGGGNWRLANGGLSLMKSNTIAFDPQNPTRLLVGTAGTGIFAMHWPVGYDINATRQYLATTDDGSFSTIAAAAAGINTAPGGKASPLLNGNMEQGNSIPLGWTNRWVGKGRILVARDPSTSYEGEASLRIQAVGGPGKGQISQIIDAKGINQVTLSAYVKSEGALFSQVAIQSFDAKWQTLQYKTVKHFRKQKDWAEIKGTVKLPPGTIRFGIGLLIEGNGKAWMDNVTLDVE